jgi:hypothetical protein
LTITLGTFTLARFANHNVAFVFVRMTDRARGLDVNAVVSSQDIFGLTNQAKVVKVYASSVFASPAPRTFSTLSSFVVASVV